MRFSEEEEKEIRDAIWEILEEADIIREAMTYKPDPDDISRISETLNYANELIELLETPMDYCTNDKYNSLIDFISTYNNGYGIR